MQCTGDQVMNKEHNHIEKKYIFCKVTVAMDSDSSDGSGETNSKSSGNNSPF